MSNPRVTSSPKPLDVLHRAVLLVFSALLEEHSTEIKSGQGCQIGSPVAVYNCFWMAYYISLIHSNLAELEGRLSPAAAAKERGQARDLQAIVEEVTAKL